MFINTFENEGNKLPADMFMIDPAKANKKMVAE
jgi:hypothetical protein